MRPGQRFELVARPSTTIPELLASHANRDLHRERPKHRARLCDSQFQRLGSGGHGSACRFQGQSLARKGETMTTAEMATYGYDQINQARAEPNTVSKSTSFESLKSHSQLCGFGWDELGWSVDLDVLLYGCVTTRCIVLRQRESPWILRCGVRRSVPV